jgi:hypothetical protein
MNVDIDSLNDSLQEAIGTVAVEHLGQGYRVLVPTGRVIHDWTVVAVEPVDTGWVVSDGGQTKQMLGDDFDTIIEQVRCAGAPFEVRSDQLVSHCRAPELVDTVVSFTHHMAVLPVMWQAEQCRSGGEASETTKQTKPWGARTMANYVLKLIEDTVPQKSHVSFVRIYAEVRGRNQRVRAPLSVRGQDISARRPRLISSFIDMTAPPQSVRNAKQATSFLFDVAADMEIPKFVGVRGTLAEVAEMQELYDRQNIAVVDMNSPKPLIDDAVEAIETLVG